MIFIFVFLKNNSYLCIIKIIDMKTTKTKTEDFIFLNVSFVEYLRKCKEQGLNHYCKDHLEVNCRVCKEKMIFLQNYLKEKN